MKNTLLIGSTCVDVIINIKDMPKAGDDMNVASQEQKLGGCTYNISDVLRHFQVPYTLCSPVGTGIYGDFVRQKLAEKNIPVFAETNDKKNGCCYCIVNSEGERSFLCEHGAEYIFNKDNFSGINIDEVDSATICGLELEEESGEAEVEYVSELKKHHEEKGLPFTLFFAPGPRILEIKSELIDKVLELNPIIHLNKTEALTFSKKSFVMDAASWLNLQTENSVIITMGEQGCYYQDAKSGKAGIVEGIPAKVKDTIGAGDSHLGAIISCLKKGLTLEQAVKNANRVSSAVVSVKGSTLTDEEFAKIQFQY